MLSFVSTAFKATELKRGSGIVILWQESPGFPTSSACVFPWSTAKAAALPAVREMRLFCVLVHLCLLRAYWPQAC